jgi:hypothetical protein
MHRVIVAILAMFALIALSGEAFAQKKKCPKGKVYSASAGKCVTPSGSTRGSTPRGSW